MEQTRQNNRTDELLERIHQLECKEAIILKESHELREQNELLEFRIIELEEGGDKVSLSFSIRISSHIWTVYTFIYLFESAKRKTFFNAMAAAPNLE